MKQRFLFLTTFYIVTVTVFVIAKIVFMGYTAADQPFEAFDMIEVVRHGLSLDLSMSLYLVCIPFLMVWASFWFPVTRAWTWTYLRIIAFCLSLVFVVDTSLYEFWQFKLDASCLQYLSTPTEAMASVSAVYILIRIIVWAITGYAIAWTYRQTAFRLWKDVFPVLPMKQRIAGSLVMLLSIPAIVIGIRGGVSESTTNVGQVYYSSNQYLNHAAVNPLFSFISSLGKFGDYIVEYNFLPDTECEQVARTIYHTESDQPTPLLATRRPNIVLVIMEGCGGQFTHIGKREDITPNLNRYCREGVFFSECYANSWRTDKGCVSILSGYPAFPVTSVMKIPEKSRTLPSIAKSLTKIGYETEFLYGGDINFSNMKSYIMGTGYNRLKWKNDFDFSEQNTAQWGVRDDIVFSRLYDDILSEKGDKPWMKTLLTLSSHEPWDVPEQKLPDKVENAFHYLDTSLGQFVEQLRKSPAWNNLLLIILPDHGHRHQNINETTRLFNHIPMVWIGGAVKQPYTFSEVCSQSDLPATLLGQMGVAHEDFQFSRDVLSANYTRPFAFHTFTNGMTVIEKNAFTAYDLDAQKTIASEGNSQERQLRLGKALLQIHSQDLKKRQSH